MKNNKKDKDPNRVWKTAAIPFGKSLHDFASKFEDTLNALEGEGREIAVHIMARGALVYGHTKQPLRVGIVSIPDDAPPDGEGQQARSSKSSFVGPILAFMRRMQDAPESVRQAALSNIFEDVTRNVSAHELCLAANDVGALIADFNNRHGDCNHPEHRQTLSLLEKLERMFREKSQAQLM